MGKPPGVMSLTSPNNWSYGPLITGFWAHLVLFRFKEFVPLPKTHTLGGSSPYLKAIKKRSFGILCLEFHPTTWSLRVQILEGVGLYQPIRITNSWFGSSPIPAIFWSFQLASAVTYSCHVELPCQTPGCLVVWVSWPQAQPDAAGLPSGELTWQLNFPIFNRRYVFKRSIFYWQVSLLEGMWSLVECFWVFNSSVPQHTQHVNSSSWAWSGPLVALWHMPTKGPWRPRRWCCKECTPESARQTPNLGQLSLSRKGWKGYFVPSVLASVKLSPLRWWSVGCQGRAPCIINAVGLEAVDSIDNTTGGTGEEIRR